MLRITENKDEIIVREIPFFDWVRAAVAGLIFFFIVCAALASKENLSDLLWVLILLTPIGAFLLFLLTTPTFSVKINKPGKTVSVRRQNLFKYSFEVYSFSEIADLIYIDTKLLGEQGRETAFYQLMLPLKTGKNIEISSSGGSKDNEYQNAVDLMNPYIFDTSKQIPFKLTVFDDD